MNSARTNKVKPRNRICAECEHLMTDAANAMRRHGGQMLAATELARTDLSEEQRDEAEVRLRESFKEANSLWNAYRRHLIEHGILPSDES